MFKKLNKKGFTLAELLVVVAIIGVLVAVSIPIFTGQLRKARLATNQANARAAYAAASAALLDNETNGSSQGKNDGTYTYTVSTAKVGTWKAFDETEATNAKATSTGISDWKVGDTVGTVTLGNTVATKWTVYIAENGVVSFSASAEKIDSNAAKK